MPLFGRMKAPNVGGAEELPLQSGEAARLYLVVRRLWLDGRMDISTSGTIDVDERAVFVVMTDLYRAWPRTAAHAWRGYEMRGRGALLLTSQTRLLNFYRVAPDRVPSWLPVQTVNYCASYDPRTEVVLTMYGFPHAGAPETAASLWIRPPDTWTAPRNARRFDSCLGGLPKDEGRPMGHFQRTVGG
jgi:hypothetical protein